MEEQAFPLWNNHLFGAQESPLQLDSEDTLMIQYKDKIRLISVYVFVAVSSVS